MPKLFTSEASRTIVSVVGALMMSTTFVVAAVGPAKAAVPVTHAQTVAAPLAC